ncbi:hypothetical protein HD806DRAFT_492402 [Xylariaceae sp. AK1471]|nr:hypothetical protein HD806DRAFT_492402 [Xylariaceae sp. AK1471]
MASWMFMFATSTLTTASLSSCLLRGLSWSTALFKFDSEIVPVVLVGSQVMPGSVEESSCLCIFKVAVYVGVEPIGEAFAHVPVLVQFVF